MGLFASLLSAALAASKDLVSKRLASRLDGTASTFASFAYALPYYAVLLVVLYLLGRETFTWSVSFLVLVLLRSVTDAAAEGLKMHALAHGDISLVACFLSLSPLFLLLTSPLLTGDRLTVVDVVAIILVVGGGLLLVYRPTSAGGTDQRKGVLLATGSAFFFSLNSCFDRLAVQEGTQEGTQLGTPVFAGFAMTLLSAVLLLPFLVRRPDRQAGLRAEWAGLWIRGLLEAAFMVSKLYALQYLQAPYVAGIQRVSLLLSILGGWVFFKEEDFGRRLLAGLLILGGVLLIVWLQWP